MKKNVLKNWNLWACIPIPAIMLMILYFTLQPGDVTTVTSGAVAEKVYHVLDGNRNPLNLQQKDLLNTYTRVFAHMTEFALLSAAVGLAASANGIRRYLRSIYMFCFCLPVAVTDEIIQSFIPGRECDIIDLGKDLFGAGLMAVLFLVFGASGPLIAKAVDGEKRRRAFMNIRIDDVAFSEAAEKIRAYAGDTGMHLVITPNADHIVKAEKDAAFRELFEKADLIVPDGMPLLWIADSLGCPLLERVTGADLLPEVCAFAQEDGRRIYFLATDEKTVSAAVEQVKSLWPGIPAVDGYAPSMNFAEDAEESAHILKKVAEFETDILVVGLGAPKSEKWIAEHKEQLQCHVALPFGAAVSFLAKEKRRAPKWMQRHGLEWFSRFLQEPFRLFRRYFIDDVKIFRLALKYRDRTISGYTGKDQGTET